MKKTTKRSIGLASFFFFCIFQIGLFILWLNVVAYFQPAISANSLFLRIIIGLSLFVIMVTTTVFCPLFIFLSIYINSVSILELKYYLQELEEKEAAKFLARMMWLSNINVRKYSGNEYLIYRMFYPQANLVPKNTILWVIKIKYKNLEFLVDNGFGKPIYYRKKFLYRFIIKPMYPNHYQKILCMKNFLNQNFLSGLTDAQINIELDELFIQ